MIDYEKKHRNLSRLFDDLEDTIDHDKQDKLIENEACNHKDSIREVCDKNVELRRRLWEYENRYRVGKYPTS